MPVAQRPQSPVWVAVALIVLHYRWRGQLAWPRSDRFAAVRYGGVRCLVDCIQVRIERIALEHHQIRATPEHFAGGPQVADHLIEIARKETLIRVHCRPQVCETIFLILLDYQPTHCGQVGLQYEEFGAAHADLLARPAATVPHYELVVAIVWGMNGPIRCVISEHPIACGIFFARGC